MKVYEYGCKDVSGEDLAGCNTFDLTYNREVAEEIHEGRFANDARMYDTKPFQRIGSEQKGQTDPGRN